MNPHPGAEITRLEADRDAKEAERKHWFDRWQNTADELARISGRLGLLERALDVSDNDIEAAESKLTALSTELAEARADASNWRELVERQDWQRFFDSLFERIQKGNAVSLEANERADQEKARAEKAEAELAEARAERDDARGKK